MGNQGCPKCGTTVRVETVADRFDGLCPGCLYQAVVAHAPTLGPGSAVAPLEGTDLGNYRVLGLLGAGGMGAVYRARQKGLERTVALKVLSATGAEEVERFFREARSAARLRHPNIVAIHEVLNDRGYYFLAMDLIDGGTLGDAIRRTPLAPRRGAEIVRTVCRAVHYAHEQGIVHRDLKPANILLDPRGDPLVTDFGLAKEISGGATLTSSGMVMGTPAYMAPEQAVGSGNLGSSIDARTDVYALGAIFYECLAGRAPFSGENAIEVLQKVLSEDPPPPRRGHPELDRDLETICLKAMEKDKSRRYESAAAMAEDLDRYLRGESILARRAGLPRRARIWVRRHPVFSVAGGVAAVLVAIFVPLLLTGAAKAREKIRRKAEAQVHLNRARERIRLGIPEQAGLELERALQLDPECAEAVFLRGMASERMSRIAEALGDYRLATRMDPSQPDAWYRLFWTLCLGEFNRIEIQMGYAAPERDREIRTAWTALGRSTLKPEQVETARALWRMRETFRSGIMRDAQNLEIRFDDEKLRALEMEMLAMLGRALQSDPVNADALFLRANVRGLSVALGAAKDPQAHLALVLADVDRGLEVEPRNREGLLTRAQVLGRMGRREEAIRVADRIVELGPNDWEAHRARGIVLSQLGDRNGALRSFDRGVELGGDAVVLSMKRIMHHLGLFELGLGRVTGDAKELALGSAELERLLQRTPDHVPALLFRFYFRIYRMDLPGALEDLARAERLDPGNPVARMIRKKFPSKSH